MNCRRCGCGFSQDEDWAMVTRHNVPMEPCGFFYLCQDCHETLIAWAGVAPDTPDLWRIPEQEEESPRPFSCGDERLELKS